MRYEWAYTASAWINVPANLEKLEKEGWEVFSVCALGGSDYCHIVHRREKAPLKLPAPTERKK